MQTQEFISIKEACQILGCGRTKIYTYYIKEGLLTIKMKRGNRSYFLKSDVVEVLNHENTPRDYVLNQSRQSPLSPATVQMQQSSENTIVENSQQVQGQIYRNSEESVRRESHSTQIFSRNEIAISDQTNELLARIYELENLLQTREHQISEFQKQLHSTIPLVEYHKELEENKKLVEETREQLKEKEESLMNAEKHTEQLISEKSKLNEQFGQSIRLAVQLKKQLEHEQSRKEQLRKLQIRWKELQGQLSQCGFFDISSRIQIHREIKQVQDAIKKFR